MYLFPTSSLAVDCFEDMSPLAASNFDSPLAAQTEAGNDSEWHFRMNSCSVQLQLGNVSTADRACQSFSSRTSFLSFADAFPARCRWTSPPHQGQNVEPKRRLRLNCFV